MLVRGEIQPGDKLPSARELAAELKVNPNTVIRAFSELEAAGIAETRRGLGTYIREDVAVEGVRLRLLREAVERFLREIQALGLSLEEARRLLSEAGDDQ